MTVSLSASSIEDKMIATTSVAAGSVLSAAGCKQIISFIHSKITVLLTEPRPLNEGRFVIDLPTMVPQLKGFLSQGGSLSVKTASLVGFIESFFMLSSKRDPNRAVEVSLIRGSLKGLLVGLSVGLASGGSNQHLGIGAFSGLISGTVAGGISHTLHKAIPEEKSLAVRLSALITGAALSWFLLK